MRLRFALVAGWAALIFIGSSFPNPPGASGGVQEPRQHLECGCLARPIRPQKANNLPSFYPKADAVNGFDLTLPPLDKAARRGHYPGFPLWHQIGFA